MSLDNIIKTIEEDAQQQINKIKSDAQDKIDELKSQYDAKRGELKIKILEKVKLEAAKKVEREGFLAKSKHNSDLLFAKQEILNQVFADAAVALSKLEKSKQVDFLKQLISVLPKGGEVVCTKASMDLVKSAVGESGKKVAISVESIDGVGGFVYSSKGVQIDNRYETLVELIRDELETKVAEKLFA